MSPVRVVLVDDHPVVLAGVKALLQSGPDFEVVGEAGTGTAALEVVCRLQPDVAVIDISMPDMNGFELAEELRQRCPDVRLLALTVHEDTAYIHRLLAAGVRGYLLKRAAADDLPHAIRAVASGGVYLDPSAAVALASAGDPQPQRVGEPESDLSARARRPPADGPGIHEQGDRRAARCQRQERRNLQSPRRCQIEPPHAGRDRAVCRLPELDRDLSLFGRSARPLIRVPRRGSLTDSGPWQHRGRGAVR